MESGQEQDSSRSRSGSKSGWGSYHPNTIPFAFCDGSINGISKSIDILLLADLATIDGGTVVSGL